MSNHGDASMAWEVDDDATLISNIAQELLVKSVNTARFLIGAGYFISVCIRGLKEACRHN